MDMPMDPKDSGTKQKGHSGWSQGSNCDFSLFFQGCQHVPGFSWLKSHHAYMDDVVASAKVEW
jgi:hypothetical protein